MIAQILVIEDNKEMARLLQIDLERAGYQASVAGDGLEGLRRFHDTRPNLVILDIGLPLMDGLTVCQRIRALSNVPILMMTARTVTENDIAEGLNLGADEFMLKPLRGVEFHARIRALLRRANLANDSHEPAAIYQDGYLDVDVPAHRVTIGGREARLTPTEFKLLETFIRNRGQVLTFQQLLEKVWGPEYTTEHHYPRIYVSHLRRKIEPDIKAPVYIQSEYGIGYRFVGRRRS